MPLVTLWRSTSQSARPAPDCPINFRAAEQIRILHFAGDGARDFGNIRFNASTGWRPSALFSGTRPSPSIGRNHDSAGSSARPNRSVRRQRHWHRLTDIDTHIRSSALRQRIGQRNGGCDMPGGNHVLDMMNDKIAQLGTRKMQQLADPGRDDGTNRGAGQRIARRLFSGYRNRATSAWCRSRR